MTTDTIFFSNCWISYLHDSVIFLNTFWNRWNWNFPDISLTIYILRSTAWQKKFAGLFLVCDSFKVYSILKYMTSSPPCLLIRWGKFEPGGGATAKKICGCIFTVGWFMSATPSWFPGSVPLNNLPKLDGLLSHGQPMIDFEEFWMVIRDF